MQTESETRNADLDATVCSLVYCTPHKPDSDLISEIEALSGMDFTLVIQCEKHNPPFVYRRCKANPTKDQQDLVFALSGGQDLKRSFSGQSYPDSGCATSYYLGWNTMGFGLQMDSCYCRICGYAMSEIARAVKVIVDTSVVSSEYVNELRQACKKAEIEFQIQ